MKTATLAASMLILAGCASPGYKDYLTAQADANRHALEGQKPLVKLVAQPGQPITGLASLEVYAPQSAPVIQQSRPNEWATVMQTGFSVLGTLGGIKLGGDAAIGLAGEIRQAGTHGYSYIQNPLTQPPPVIVTQPAPTVVTAPDPVIVKAPDPVIVNPIVVRPEVVPQ